MDTNTEALSCLSPLDGRYRGKLEDLRPWFSEYGLLRHRVEIEVLWLVWLSDQDGIDELAPLSDNARLYLYALIDSFDIGEADSIKQLEGKTRHDVKAVELYVRQKLIHNDAPPELAAAAPFVHATCTSEDINNLSYALMIARATDTVLVPAASELLASLRCLASEHADTAMAARTHGQLATPTTWGKEMAVYAQRLSNAVKQFSTIPIEGKFNGAVGNYNAHHLAWPELNWPKICHGFVENLGLRFNPCTTQIEPGDWLVRWLNELALLDSILIDCSRDMWAYIAINWLTAKPPDSNEVGSSTMPHKVNPIDFENAEGNLSIALGMAQTLAREIPISRWQRDLSGSTRLRNLGVVAAHSLLAWRSMLEGLRRIDVNAEAMADELEQHYELLGEALQTEMRRVGLPDAYETIKSFTHGRHFNRATWEQLLKELNLPASSQEKLLPLRPADYTGRAQNLVRGWVKEWASD